MSCEIRLKGFYRGRIKMGHKQRLKGFLHFEIASSCNKCIENFLYCHLEKWSPLNFGQGTLVNIRGLLLIMWVFPRLKEWQNTVTFYVPGLCFLGLLVKNPLQGISFLFLSFCLLSAQLVFLQRLKVAYWKVLSSFLICDPGCDIEPLGV